MHACSPRPRTQVGLLLAAAVAAICFAPSASDAAAAAGDAPANRAVTITFDEPTWAPAVGLTLDARDPAGKTLATGTGAADSPTLQAFSVPESFDDSLVLTNDAHGRAWRISDRGSTLVTPINSPKTPRFTGFAGESGAVDDNGDDMVTTDTFFAEVQFRSAPKAGQFGLVTEVSASCGKDCRHGLVKIVDRGTGLDLVVVESGNNGITGSCTSFTETPLYESLAYDKWHTLGISIRFVDGLGADGTGNDIVRIYLNGVLRHCGTSFESCYAYTPAIGEPCTDSSFICRKPRGVDRLSITPAFLSGSAHAGGGILFDNIYIGESCPNGHCGISAASGHPSTCYVAEQFSASEYVASTGAIDWASLSIGADTFLVLAHNASLDVYKYDTILLRAVPHHDVPLEGEFSAITSFSVPGAGVGPFIAVAAYKSDAGSFATSSGVFRWSATTSSFVLHQLLPSKGARDVATIAFGGQTFLALANSFDGTSSIVNSNIFRWDASAGLFVPFQSILTESASSVRFFEDSPAGALYLAVSSFAKNSLHSLGETRVFRLGSSTNQFEPITTVPSASAHDLEVFRMNGDTFIAIASLEGDADDSLLLRWNSSTSTLDLVQTLEHPGARDIAYFTFANKHYLAVASSYDVDSDGSKVFAQDSAIYQLIDEKFEIIQYLPSTGANAFHFFEHLGLGHLALANRFDGVNSSQVSVIFSHKDLAACASAFCENNSVCKDSASTGAICQCKSGFFGYRCHMTICGDRIIAGSEQCDHGNNRNGDGCDSNCKIEPGWTCSGTPSVCSQLFTTTLMPPLDCRAAVAQNKNCFLCDQNTGKCLRCRNSMYLYNDQCVDVSMCYAAGIPPFGSTVFGRMCKKLPFVCRKSEGCTCPADKVGVGCDDCDIRTSGITCRNCAASKFFSNAKCVDRLTCKGPQMTEIPVPCSCADLPGCTACNYRGGWANITKVCTTCSSGFSLRNGTCIDPRVCPGDLVSYGPTLTSRVCVAPFSCNKNINSISGESCVCPQNTVCSACDWTKSGGVCTQCRSNKFQSNGTCVDVCPGATASVGYRSFSRVCIPATTFCRSGAIVSPVEFRDQVCTCPPECTSCRWLTGNKAGVATCTACTPQTRLNVSTGMCEAYR